MTDAEVAIQEILTALDEYGTDIILIKVAQGAYNPSTGSTTTETEIPLKALINKSASVTVSRQVQGNESLSGYEFSLMFYHTESPSTAWKVKYNNKVYKVTLVAPYILQNTTFKYEVLIKR